MYIYSIAGTTAPTTTTSPATSTTVSITTKAPGKVFIIHTSGLPDKMSAKVFYLAKLPMEKTKMTKINFGRTMFSVSLSRFG